MIYATSADVPPTHGTAAHIDRLALLFARQRAFEQRLKTSATPYARRWRDMTWRERCLDLTRALVRECGELDDEIGWKHWRALPTDAEIASAACRARRLDEYADILLFAIALGVEQSFAPDEIVDACMRKQSENHARQDAQYATDATAAPSAETACEAAERREGTRDAV